MSNTSLGRAYKGSKYMMQMAASPLQRDLFDTFLNDNLQWLSPLEEDNYAEYELKDSCILNALGIHNCEDGGNRTNCFGDFWPDRQPQWDAIALGKNTLYLFEAKSHADELKSECKAKEPSRTKIVRSLEITAHKLGLKDLPQSWTKEYYQLANRLAFLHKMKEIASQNVSGIKFKKVKLVLVNFVDDPTWDTSHRINKEQWKGKYKEVLNAMQLAPDYFDNPQNDVIEVFYTAPSISG